MTVIPFDQTVRTQFEAMLVDYFNELESGIPEPVIRGKLLELILTELRQDILRIAIATENAAPIGFSIYQIDTESSDWCKKPGWGCIREFYIAPTSRRKGFGTRLADRCAQDLLDAGAKGLYLTADEAVPFWNACGYSNTHEICTNDLEILTK